MKTKIKFQDGTVECLNVSKMEFIPNGMFKEIQKLLAKSNEERVGLINSHSSYEHRRIWMSKEMTEEHIYPCIQNVNTKNEISCFWYSNTNRNGHFNVPKVVFSRKVCGVYLDYNGEFGCCEDCSFIVDSIENLAKIQIALESKELVELMKMCDFSGSRDRYNRKIIKLFRKDWWKEFQ